MKVGSLFSGIGGLDLGLERAGMTVAWQSEIDPYACRVLAKHWPHVPNLGDITLIDWSTVEPVDLICGGYPCQPFSLAGVRQGEADPRHLWPYFADAIRLLRPRFALLENVPGHLSLGFGSVLGDLAELGYDADWDCIAAAAVGAPHLRYRIFVVAHTNCGRFQEHGQRDSGQIARFQPSLRHNAGRLRAYMADAAESDGRRATRGLRSTNAAESTSEASTKRWHGSCTDIISDRREDTGEHWTIEPDVGRVAHGIPNRVDRLRTLGNAVVPQVAEYVGRRIMEAVA